MVGDVSAVIDSREDCRALVAVVSHPAGEFGRALQLADYPKIGLDDYPPQLYTGVTTANWLPDVWVKRRWDAEVHLGKLHDAIVFGGLIQQTWPGFHERGQLILTARGGLIDASLGVWNGEGLRPADLLSKKGGEWQLTRNLPRERLLGEHLLLGNLQPHFGHTVLEGLTRAWPVLLDEVRQRDLRYLVYEPHLRPFQEKLLQAAGIDPSRVVHVPPQGVIVESVLVPDQAMRSHRWLSALQAQVWRRIASTVPAGDAATNVYLSRRNVSDRPLVNEDEVEEFFRREGFTIVNPERLSIEKQIEVVAGAQSIAGAVGSQMYLAAFQQGGVRNWTLAPRNFFAKDDCMIAKANDCAANVVFGSSIDHLADRKLREWRIDIDRLAARYPA